MTPPLSFATAATKMAGLLAERPMVRTINYHNTPWIRAAEIRDQLRGLSRDYGFVTENDLDRYLTTGRWHKSKPGVIIALYEVYRNGFDVMLPLLEEFGFIGWFFVITDFVKAPVPEQLNFALSHEIDMATREYSDGRYALSWEELRAIDRKHVVASHARTHVLLSKLDPVRREEEVIGSQRDFEKHLGHPVRTFVSYGGPAYGEDPATDALIKSAGYQFVVSNLKLQRIRQ
jgi:peptidoglycan/xylan/chitin deacetylase (PgdA/CDA1 family)